MIQVDDIATSFDKYVFFVAAALSLLVPTLSLLGKHDLLPFAFVLTILSQHNSLTHLTLNIANRTFPSIFSAYKTTILCLLSYTSNAFSLVGFNQSISHWSNILKLILAIVFIPIFSQLLETVFKECSSRKFNAAESYAICHLVIYCFIMTITGFTASWFYFSWKDFNSSGVIVYSYAMVLHLALVGIIPPKVARACARESDDCCET
jgi:hypothetical protein